MNSATDITIFKYIPSFTQLIFRKKFSQIFAQENGASSVASVVEKKKQKNKRQATDALHFHIILLSLKKHLT
jgi:hypothetical protein